LSSHFVTALPAPASRSSSAGPRDFFMGTLDVLLRQAYLAVLFIEPEIKTLDQVLSPIFLAIVLDSPIGFNHNYKLTKASSNNFQGRGKWEFH
jgi:hypothetical protein